MKAQPFLYGVINPCLPVGMAEYYGAKVEAAVRASRSDTPCLSLQDGGSAQSFPPKPCLVCQRHLYRHCNIQVPDAQRKERDKNQ